MSINVYNSEIMSDYPDIEGVAVLSTQQDIQPESQSQQASISQDQQHSTPKRLKSGSTFTSDIVREGFLLQAPKRKNAAPVGATAVENCRSTLFNKPPTRFDIGNHKKVQLTMYQRARRITIRNYKEGGSTSSRSISLTVQQYRELRLKKDEILKEIIRVKNDPTERGLVHLGSGRFCEIYWWGQYFQIAIRKIYKHKVHQTFVRDPECGIILEEDSFYKFIQLHDTLVDHDVELKNFDGQCYTTDGHKESQCLICNPYRSTGQF